MSLHTKEHDIILSEMTKQEKTDRMQSSAMKKRGIVITDYKYWILCKNEFPYVGYANSLVIRYKMHHERRPHGLARAEKGLIQREREEKGYSIKRNCEKDRSIDRYHEHFLLK